MDAVRYFINTIVFSGYSDKPYSETVIKQGRGTYKQNGNKRGGAVF